MTHLNTLRIGLAAASLAMTSAAAMAHEPVPSPQVAASGSTDRPMSVTASDAELADLSGGANVHNTLALTEQDLTAVNSGNSIQADLVGSGSISLQDNALSGYSGIGNFVMNTGHNNNLQSSMSVTIIVTQ